MIIITNDMLAQMGFENPVNTWPDGNEPFPRTSYTDWDLALDEEQGVKLNLCQVFEKRNENTLYKQVDATLELCVNDECVKIPIPSEENLAFKVFNLKLLFECNKDR